MKEKDFNLTLLIQEINQFSQPQDVPFLQRFFKTGPGEYAEGDILIGVRNPPLRALSKKYYNQISLKDVQSLLKDPIHEYRLIALFILVLKYQNAKKSLEDKNEIVQLYLDHIPYINNWDLVDSSAYKLLGAYVYEQQKFDLLVDLAHDENLWAKRIAVVSLLYLWKRGYIHEGLELLKINLRHPHDLMHKATGWMLRELGKVDEDAMLSFLFEHYDDIPRTTLRYAIEKIQEPLRTQILKKLF